MALQPYRDEELNFFKFTSIVLNEFPKVLRQTFKTMWDNTYGHCPSFQLWDDSTAVRNMFAATEGGGSKVPTHRPYGEWDCTALFQATIYARSFASHGQTLNDLYLKPHGVPHGSFYASVVSPTGKQAETFALSIDQLRLLRNWLCHSSSSEMEKTTFDQYVQYAKDAFKALGASTALIDAVENLTESDFPTNEVRKLEKGVKEETRAYMAFLESVNSDIMELRSLSAAIKEKVESDTATKDDVALLEQKIDERERILEEVSSDISEIKQKDKEFMDKLEEKISELRTAHDERNASNTNSDGIPLLRRPCLPPRVPYFTGRQKECDEIIGHLFSESTRIVSICGSPGFGKTSVAVAVGHEVQSRGLPVFWLSLRGLRSKADLTSKLLSFFRQPSKNTFSSQHLSRDDELCQLFSEISDDLVFILDNADDLLESGLPKVNREEVVEFLEEILRRNQNVKFAITTRESFGFLNLHLEFHQSVRIRPLEEASSRSLVHELLPDASISDCKRITQICGHVPLAIKLLCSSISEDSAQPSQFLNELLVSSTESIVEMLDSPGYPTNHRLRFLFNSSFERLCKQEKEALVSFSVLPENFDTEVAASVLGKTVRLTKNILQSLERKSLLDSSLERRSFKMHKLLQLFARERGNDEMKEIFDDSKSRLHAYYLSLFERLNEQFLTGHSMSAFVAFYEDKQNIVQSLVDGCSYSETADRVFDVLDNAEIFLDSIFWTHSSATCPFDLIYDSALKAASRYGNTVYYGRLLVSKSFGQLMWGVKGRSLKLLREVDEIRQAATPCTRDEKAKYLCYFGMYHLVTREIESGVKCLQEALPLMSNSPEHRILRLVIFQIFALYWQVEKNRSHSRQFYGKALLESMAIGDIQLLVIPSSEMETATETKGRKIPSRCADTLRNKPLELQIIYHVLQASQHLPVIGTNKSLQDIVLKIRDDVEAALPCGETGLFSFHRVVVATLLNVFSKCKEKGNLPAHSQTSREQKQQEESGNSKHETAKEYYSASSGKNCKDPDNVKNKQCILVSSGALQSRQRATDIAIERFGAEHPNTADSYHTLGITQHLLGDFTSALRSLQKALNIRQVVLGNDHLGTADIYRSLGATHYQLGDFSAALQCRQQALDIRRKDLGEEHASLVEGYIELSCTQFALGDFSSAVESNKRALEVCIKMFGEEDPRTPCILLSLANTQRLLGDLTTALEYAECALCISVRLFGTENVITASGYCSLGDIHLSLENHAVARYYYEIAHNIDARLFGNEHVNTLRYTYLQLVQLVQFASIHHLKVNAINFILVSDLNAALQDALSALSLDVNLYGEEHVYTADSFYLLGSIQFQLFDFNSSLYCHERALDIKLKVLGEEHSGTVISFMFLALVHFALGNFTTAKEYAECALSIRPRLSEEDIIANFFECCLLILAIEIVTVAFEQVDNALN